MKIIVMLNVIMDINIKRIHAIVERDNLSVIANFRLYHPLTIWAMKPSLWSCTSYSCCTLPTLVVCW
jgi:hypothetical protein